MRNFIARLLARFIVRRRYVTLVRGKPRTSGRGAVNVIRYLAQKFCVDNDTKQREALAALAGLAPQLQALLKAAGVSQ